MPSCKISGKKPYLLLPETLPNCARNKYNRRNEHCSCSGPAHNLEKGWKLESFDDPRVGGHQHDQKHEWDCNNTVHNRRPEQGPHRIDTKEIETDARNSRERQHTIEFRGLSCLLLQAGTPVEQ